jgi:hypothetical protein
VQLFGNTGLILCPGCDAPINTKPENMEMFVASAREYGKVLREAMRIADRLNGAFDAAEPWVLAKNPAARDRLQTVCSQALQGFQLLTVMLAPVLPRTASRVARELFGLDRELAWGDAWRDPQLVRPFKHLMQRIDPKQVDALLEGPKAATPPATGKTLTAHSSGSAKPRTTVAAHSAIAPNRPGPVSGVRGAGRWLLVGVKKRARPRARCST